MELSARVSSMHSDHLFFSYVLSILSKGWSIKIKSQESDFARRHKRSVKTAEILWSVHGRFDLCAIFLFQLHDFPGVTSEIAVSSDTVKISKDFAGACDDVRTLHWRLLRWQRNPISIRTVLEAVLYSLSLMKLLRIDFRCLDRRISKSRYKTWEIRSRRRQDDTSRSVWSSGCSLVTNPYLM